MVVLLAEEHEGCQANDCGDVAIKILDGKLPGCHSHYEQHND